MTQNTSVALFQQSQVALLCGMTGSGKTTLAIYLEEDISAVRFSIDEWMIKLYGHHMSREDFDRNMKSIKQLIWQVVDRLVLIGTNVVLDYGFWQASEREIAYRRIKEKGAIPIVYFLNVPLSTLKQRLAKRNSNLSEGTFEITSQMLETFSANFEPPQVDEGIQIIELDGTDDSYKKHRLNLESLFI